MLESCALDGAEMRVGGLNGHAFCSVSVSRFVGVWLQGDILHQIDALSMLTLNNIIVYVAARGGMRCSFRLNDKLP